MKAFREMPCEHFRIFMLHTCALHHVSRRLACSGSGRIECGLTAMSPAPYLPATSFVRFPEADCRAAGSQNLAEQSTCAIEGQPTSVSKIVSFAKSMTGRASRFLALIRGSLNARKLNTKPPMSSQFLRRSRCVPLLNLASLRRSCDWFPTEWISVLSTHAPKEETTTFIFCLLAPFP